MIDELDLLLEDPYDGATPAARALGRRMRRELRLRRHPRPIGGTTDGPPGDHRFFDVEWDRVLPGIVSLRPAALRAGLSDDGWWTAIPGRPGGRPLWVRMVSPTGEELDRARLVSTGSMMLAMGSLATVDGDWRVCLTHDPGVGPRSDTEWSTQIGRQRQYLRGLARRAATRSDDEHGALFLMDEHVLSLCPELVDVDLRPVQS